MKKFLIVCASFSALAVLPATSFADTVVVDPGVDTWVMEQPENSVEVQGDVVVGGVLPDTVEVVEVPKFKKYRYAVVNKHRVLVDAGTRKIIKVYK
ncbi:MAG: DUF1236 domain-containing protein [Hyphomicrobiales bacterium]